MNTYTQILYQIVFSPKNHEKTLDAANRPELFRYIWGILQNKKCYLYRIGGVSDHIHIITGLHPTVPLASLIKDIKLASSEFIKLNNLFPGFSGWQDGYGGFTYSIKERDRLVEYVKSQEENHKAKTYIEELKELFHEHQIEYDEKYLR